MLFVAILVALMAQTLHAQQTPDSLALERRIAEAYPNIPTRSASRKLLLRTLQGGQFNEATSLMWFMDRRAKAGNEGWMTAAERLVAALIASDVATLDDRARMTDLLTSAVGKGQHPLEDDRLFENLRSLLNGGLDRVVARYDSTRPSSEARRFFELLINHVNVSGYRAREQLNARVDRFASDFPTSWRAMLAEQTIQRPYAEADVGGAFVAGYSTGNFSGELGERFSDFRGPVLGGELYYLRLVLSGVLTIGVGDIEHPFAAAGEIWPVGTASFINAGLGLGYEIRFDRVALTPIAGLAMQSSRAPGQPGAAIEDGPRTHDRIGLDVGVVVGYRIPFDVGPSIDLRLRLDRASTSLNDFDPGFSGAVYSIQVCFALVHRPYQRLIW